MIDRCTWLPECVNQFDATNVMSETDMLDAIKNYGDLQKSSFEQSAVDIDDVGLTL